MFPRDQNLCDLCVRVGAPHRKVRTRVTNPGGDRVRRRRHVACSYTSFVRPLPHALMFSLLAACAAEPTEHSGHSASSALEAPDSVTTSPILALDVGIDARVKDAPPNGDPDRVLELTAPLVDLPAGSEVLDARWVEGRALVLHPDHSLWVHGPEGRRRIDDLAEAPLSVRDGAVTYVRGEMPFFEVVLLPNLDSEPQQLTDGYGPAWNPALGPDHQVVFASSREGQPGLYRVRPGQAPERLENEGTFPSSVHAPVFDGTTLRFEDELGAEHALTLRVAANDAPGVLR